MIDINKIYEMEKEIQGEKLEISEFSSEDTALIVVDMVNGFVHEGILSSPRIVDIISNIYTLNEKTLGFKKVFFIDEHEETSAEFDSYAKHCIKGTSEAKLIDELSQVATKDKNATFICKNSTNGFHAEGFKDWLKINEDRIKNYIVVGCEVDICVSHFALTLKTYFNQKNLHRRIIVPSNAVETFDFGTHHGDLMKIIALWEMKANGIEIVDEIY